MGNKWKKILIVIAIALCMGLGVFGANNISPQVVEATSTEVTIENINLKNRLLALLGKGASEKLYVDDFVNHTDYSSGTIKYLDLDNINLHNISELAKFEWPSTLAGISLARNNITNEDLQGLVSFASITAGADVTYHGQTFQSVSNISTILKKINLNFNTIDLDELNTTMKDNDLLLFGIQNITGLSQLLTDEEAANVKHYIRQSDPIYLSYNISFTDYQSNSTTGSYQSVNNDLKQPIQVIDASNYGSYTINVSSLVNSETAYFYGYNDTLGGGEFSFKHISIEFNPDFFVERGHILYIKDSLDDLNNWVKTDKDLFIKGFENITAFNYTSTDLNKDISISHYCVITITGDGVTRSFSIEYKVDDTIAPVIVLNGKSRVYTSRGKVFIDPGFRAYDPITIGDNDGDDISDSVIMYDIDAADPTTEISIGSNNHSTLNTSQLGTRRIKYEITDGNGHTTSVIRIVEIQTQVLDRVILRLDSDEIKLNTQPTIFAEPDTGVALDRYKDYKYEWYFDGIKVETTYPIDNVSKKTSYSIPLGSLGQHTIKVKLIAKQVADNEEIEVEASKEITIVANLSDNSTLLLAVALPIVLIILIIALITYIRYRKRNSKTHHKTSAKAKKNAKKQTNNESDITVIKDYHGGTTGSTGSSSTGSSGGGNENNRLPETQDNNMDRE